MRKYLCLLLSFLFFSFMVSAQSINGRITGIISDKTGKPIPSATVSLIRLSDSATLKSTTTSKDGRYEFSAIQTGEYFVTATSVGFDKVSAAHFKVSEEKLSIDIATITMNDAAKAIEGVTVTGRRPFIETRIDKTVINVEASPTSAGATALEVLEKSPGVMVSNDGVISLRGKAGVIVMMDGKQTFLSATDLASMLKNMPASALDQIEIMTNPSAKYDAAGNSGIINIKTKKGAAGGFNGSVMAGITNSIYGYQGNTYIIPKSQNSITFNYRKNKINFFGNYNPNVFNGRSNLKIARTVLDEQKDTLGFNSVSTNFKFGNVNHTLKLGIDYMPNKNNTFGFVVSGFTFSGHPTPVTTTKFYDPQNELLSTMESETENRIKFNNFSTNFNYRHIFDTTGRELTADLDYIVYSNTSRMTLLTHFRDAAGNQTASDLLLRGYLPADIEIFSAKSDYVHPLKNGSKIEAGFKTSIVSNDNLVDYKRWQDNKWLNDSRSNHFIYDENINAVYLNGSTQLKKWSFQGGLRLENTIAKGYQVTNDSTFKRNFTNLFPSAFISYAIDKKNQLTVSYSRRVTRPNYQDLNPFIYFLDSVSYRKGNPFLLPQFTHKMELSHSFKSKLITTINYDITRNVISQILKPEGNIVFATSDNVARFRNMGLAITLPVPVTKWWNLNLFGNVYNNHYKGIYNGKPLDESFTSFMINMTQSFTLKNGYTLEMNGFYQARNFNQLSINEPMYVLSFGGQKTVLKGKGTLRLNLRDPFWLQRFSGKTQFDIVDSRISNRWDNRQITASFTYRFGKSAQQSPPPRRRNSASQDEQNRIGQGAQN